VVGVIKIYLSHPKPLRMKPLLLREVIHAGSNPARIAFNHLSSKGRTGSFGLSLDVTISHSVMASTRAFGSRRFGSKPDERARFDSSSWHNGFIV
jgi:hypothetical protein